MAFIVLLLCKRRPIIKKVSVEKVSAIPAPGIFVIMCLIFTGAYNTGVTDGPMDGQT